ncbi:acyl carrier protein [Streptomyces sp. NPDC050658]|uniref:acyl carrier protein n=1 Tax=unclassified Streptomyces TaxID=2593676 RepID=UPI0034474627
MWNDQFEGILRRNLPSLAADEPLTPDLVLRDFGLDSMAMVEVLAELEDTFGVRFVDDAMDIDNFATPAALWGTVSTIVSAAA